MLSNIQWLADYAIMAFSLWLGLYLLPRSSRNRFHFSVLFLLLIIGLEYLGLLLMRDVSIPSFLELRDFAVTSEFALLSFITHLLLPEELRKKYRWLLVLVGIFGFVALMVLISFPAERLWEGEQLLIISEASPPLRAYQAFLMITIFLHLFLALRSRNFPVSPVSITAVFVAISSMLYGIFGSIVDIPLPRIISSALVIISLAMLGYAITRFHELLEWRLERRAVPLSALLMASLLIVFYSIAAKLGLTPLAITLLSVFLIFSHGLYASLAEQLQRNQYQQEQIRVDQIRQLARQGALEQSLDRTLGQALAIICQNLQSKGGFIAVLEDDVFVVQATRNSLDVGTGIESKAVDLEIVGRPEGQLIGQVNWLAPGYGGNDLLAVVGVNGRRGLRGYSSADREWLQDVADHLGALVFAHQSSLAESPQESAYEAAKTNSLFATLAYTPDPKLYKMVEKALRNYNDIIKLGDSALVSYLQIEGDTHLERGKQLQSKLLHTIEALRPEGPEPSDHLGRQWYSYKVLYDAYVQELPDNEIMARIYISESTFYRYRRKAVRAITRTLMETLSTSNMVFA